MAHLYKKKREGFTLIFSALMASLLLSISLVIANIALKESKLSSIATESQFAIYAADAGVECVLYWDQSADAFNPTLPETTINCLGQNFSGMGGNGIYPSTETFTLNLPTGYCTIVEITKTSAPNTTNITSRGLNTCDPTSNRRVERALLVSY